MKIFYRLMRKKIKLFFLDKDLKYSFGSIFIIIIVSTVLLALSMVGKTYDYEVGDIAREDVRVPRDIYYQNEVETAVKIQRVQKAVPVVFDKDASVLRDILRSNGLFFNTLKNVMEENPLIGTDDVTFQLLILKKQLPRNLLYPDDVLSALIRYRDYDRLHSVMNKIFIYVYDAHQGGILEEPYDNPLDIPNTSVSIRAINQITDAEEVSKSLDDLVTIDEKKGRVRQICNSIAPGIPSSTRNAIAGIVHANIEPDLYFNADETRRRISEARSEVKPVMNILKKGQTLVREGDTVTSDIQEKIQIHNRHIESVNVNFITGLFIIQLVFMLIFGYFIVEYRRFLIPDRNSIFIISTMVIVFMFYAFFVSRSETVMAASIFYVLLMPIPFVTMIVSILYNIYLAMIVGVGLVSFVTVLGGGDTSIMIIAFSSALVGVFINANVEKRTDFLRGGFFLGLINSIILVALALIDDLSPLSAAGNFHFAFASGIINSILVLGILPLYENIFGITTKFKLLELSDLNADIFKEMLLKAPGTYNHSLLVSTMAEAACKEIQANHLLARVGSFYHDIGKINDAGMYIENRVTDPRAKKMAPKEYCELIISHVEKGVETAREQMLPESVIDFIREHHGQTMMTFFYHQALEEASLNGNASEINKADFQYPGPKPRSKETAVVMLADAIEAASRSLHDPSEEKLQGLARKIIYNRLNEGDLEFSDLSMTDLNTIEKSFLTILNGIFHTRIDYPDRDEVKSLEKNIKNRIAKRLKSRNTE